MAFFGGSLSSNVSGAQDPFILWHCYLECVVCEIVKRGAETVDSPASGGRGVIGRAWLSDSSAWSLTAGRPGNVGQEEEEEEEINMGAVQCIALYLPPLSAWELLFTPQSH